MNATKYLQSIVAILCITIIVFAAVSLVDILISVFYSRFYSNAAFIVTFGVGGIFAAAISFYGAINYTSKNETARWALIIILVSTGLLFFFLLSGIEGGEYQSAFKAFGATLALGSLLFVKGKLN
jgi:hypothetical protein